MKKRLKTSILEMLENYSICEIQEGVSVVFKGYESCKLGDELALIWLSVGGLHGTFWYMKNCKRVNCNPFD